MQLESLRNVSTLKVPSWVGLDQVSKNFHENFPKLHSAGDFEILGLLCKALAKWNRKSGCWAVGLQPPPTQLELGSGVLLFCRLLKMILTQNLVLEPEKSQSTKLKLKTRREKVLNIFLSFPLPSSKPIFIS